MMLDDRERAFKYPAAHWQVPVLDGRGGLYSSHFFL